MEIIRKFISDNRSWMYLSLTIFMLLMGLSLVMTANYLFQPTRPFITTFTDICLVSIVGGYLAGR